MRSVIDKDDRMDSKTRRRGDIEMTIMVRLILMIADVNVRRFMVSVVLIRIGMDRNMRSSK